MYPHYPDVPVTNPNNPPLMANPLGCLMVGGYLLFIVAMICIGVALSWKDHQRAEQRRVQCERNSPPWKTAECAAVK